MRSALLLLLTVALTSSTQAATKWLRTAFNLPGQGVERGDLTGDGYPDLFIYDAAHITILHNAASLHGRFDAGAPVRLNMGISSPVILAFNHNGGGGLDVAGCGANGSGVVLLLSNGINAPTVAQPITGPCAWVASADFNKDGNADLAVGQSADPHHPTNHNLVTVYFGDGAGGISGQVVNDNVDFVSSDGNACNLSGFARAGDLTGDRIPDIAISADCPNDTASQSALIIGTADGSGHFSFHKDQEMAFDSGMKLRFVDADQNGKLDIYASAHGSGPHAESWSDLILFRGHGDGTFAPFETVVKDGQTAEKTLVGPGSIIDIDGDGLMDAIAVVGFQNVDETTTTYQMQFYKGQSDGSFKLTETTQLANGALDMIWGDFDVDGIPDLALVRSQAGTNTTDVWVNRTDMTLRCAPVDTQRISVFCTTFPPTPGSVHIIARPFDTQIIDAIQIYVDGVLKFETHDEILNRTFQLGPGQHRVTAKAWDDLGPFSSTRTVTTKNPCLNTTNRTVKICEPQNAAVFINTIGVVRIIAKAATNLPFRAIQVYVDGKLIFQDASPLLVEDFLLLATPSETHHITVKGWDSAGAFSSSVVATTRREIN